MKLNVILTGIASGDAGAHAAAQEKLSNPKVCEANKARIAKALADAPNPPAGPTSEPEPELSPEAVKVLRGLKRIAKVHADSLVSERIAENGRTFVEEKIKAYPQYKADTQAELERLIDAYGVLAG